MSYLPAGFTTAQIETAHMQINITFSLRDYFHLVSVSPSQVEPERGAKKGETWSPEEVENFHEKRS